MGKSSIVKKAQHRLEYVLLVIFGVVFRAMPAIVMYGILDFMGWCAFHVFKIRRGVAVDNLRHALGNEYSERELLGIARKSYTNIGIAFAEMLCIPIMASRVREIVDISGIEILEDVGRRGKGVILVSGHFGNWELNGGVVSTTGMAISVVAKPQSNPLVDNLVNEYRELFGVKIIATGAPIKRIVKALRTREVIGLVSDQDSGKRGVFVDFFGRKASTPQGAAQLALKYGSPIIVTGVVRTGIRRYKAINREVEVVGGDTIQSLTQRYTSVLEEIIREYPEQYFWMHRRWKTQPSAEDYESE